MSAETLQTMDVTIAVLQISYIIRQPVNWCSIQQEKKEEYKSPNTFKDPYAIINIWQQPRIEEKHKIPI